MGRILRLCFTSLHTRLPSQVFFFKTDSDIVSSILQIFNSIFFKLQRSSVLSYFLPLSFEILFVFLVLDVELIFVLQLRGEAIVELLGILNNHVDVINQIVNSVMQSFQSWSQVNVNANSCSVVHRCHILVNLSLESTANGIFDVCELDVESGSSFLHLIERLLNLHKFFSF